MPRRGRRGATIWRWRDGDGGARESSGPPNRCTSPEGDIYLLRPSAGLDVRIEQARRGRPTAAGGARRRAHAGGAQRRVRRGGGRRHDLPDAELDVIEDAADDELIDPPNWPASIVSCATSPTSAAAAWCPRSASGGCARRRSRCSGSAGSAAGRPGARHLRGRRDVDDRRRPGRDVQPQPPDPLHRGRHRPAEGRVRRGPAARLQPGGEDHGDGAAAGERRSRSPTSSTVPTSSSTRPTGPPTTSSAGATAPASRPASPTSR